MKATRSRQLVFAFACTIVSASLASGQGGSLRIKQRPQVQRHAATSFETPQANDFGAGELSYDDGVCDEGCSSEICGSSGSCGCADGLGIGRGGILSWLGLGYEDACTPSVITAGVELTFLKPHFESNVAATQLDSDGVSNESFTDVEFDFDAELAPRVWLDFTTTGNMGIRAIWWEFDHDADPVSLSPPNNGFGGIIPPPFGPIDLSTTTPGSVYNATTQLFASTIDLEATRGFDNGCWQWLAAAGLRYAEIEQTYLGDLTNAAGDQQGTINFRHQNQGIGPTLFARAQRPLLSGVTLFGSARGSLLFGDADSELNAVEDVDLDDLLMTQRRTSRDDLIPLSEMQVGLQFLPPSCSVWQPYLHIAMEGQYWGGVGNASSEDGSLGFFGGNVAIGIFW
jgi:hypothetical protein